jgi:hypothetical protein
VEKPTRTTPTVAKLTNLDDSRFAADWTPVFSVDRVTVPSLCLVAFLFLFLSHTPIRRAFVDGRGGGVSTDVVSLFSRVRWWSRCTAAARARRPPSSPSGRTCRGRPSRTTPSRRSARSGCRTTRSAGARAARPSFGSARGNTTAGRRCPRAGPPH